MHTQTIYLIRHGETTGDLEDRFGGDYDDHLTDRGFHQATLLTQKLAGLSIDLVLHSPLVRACEVTNVVVGTLGLPSEKVSDLRERNHYGILTGLIKSEACKQYPYECAKLEQDSTHHTVHGSEPYKQFSLRVTHAMQKIQDRPEKIVAIITHGGVINCIGNELLDTPDLFVGDCGMVTITHDAGQYTTIAIEEKVE